MPCGGTQAWQVLFLPCFCAALTRPVRICQARQPLTRSVRKANGAKQPILPGLRMPQARNVRPADIRTLKAAKHSIGCEFRSTCISHPRVNTDCGCQSVPAAQRIVIMPFRRRRAVRELRTLQRKAHGQRRQEIRARQNLARQLRQHTAASRRARESRRCRRPQYQEKQEKISQTAAPGCQRRRSVVRSHITTWRTTPVSTGSAMC